MPARLALFCTAVVCFAGLRSRQVQLAGSFVFLVRERNTRRRRPRPGCAALWRHSGHSAPINAARRPSSGIQVVLVVFARSLAPHKVRIASVRTGARRRHWLRYATRTLRPTVGHSLVAPATADAEEASARTLDVKLFTTRQTVTDRSRLPAPSNQIASAFAALS
jgi:hypothetical protein